MATEKVSVTIDKDLAAELRAIAGKRGMSRIANEALADWLHANNMEQIPDEAETKRLAAKSRPPGAAKASQRLGFLKGQIEGPDDFKRMGGDEIGLLSGAVIHRPSEKQP